MPAQISLSPMQQFVQAFPTQPVPNLSQLTNLQWPKDTGAVAPPNQASFTTKIPDWFSGGQLDPYGMGAMGDNFSVRLQSNVDKYRNKFGTRMPDVMGSTYTVNNAGASDDQLRAQISQWPQAVQDLAYRLLNISPTAPQITTPGVSPSRTFPSNILTERFNSWLPMMQNNLNQSQATGLTDLLGRFNAGPNPGAAQQYGQAQESQSQAPGWTEEQTQTLLSKLRQLFT